MSSFIFFIVLIIVFVQVAQNKLDATNNYQMAFKTRDNGHEMR